MRPLSIILVSFCLISAQSVAAAAERGASPNCPLSSDDVSVRYLKAAAKVAETAYLQAIEANKKVPGTVPQAELNRLLLKKREMELAIEKFKTEKDTAGLQATHCYCDSEGQLWSKHHGLHIAPRRYCVHPVENVVPLFLGKRKVSSCDPCQ